MNSNLFRAAVCGLLLTASCGWLSVAGPSEQLPENILRLHVVANSDSEADQTLKLAVRDAVLSEAAHWCQDAGDLQEANVQICTHLESITDAAQHTVDESGYTDQVTATVTEEFFPTRQYENFLLPAGRYRALRVVIGQGAGHNWWCVVFPALCLPAVESEDVLSALPPDQRAVTDGQEERRVSLKLVELYEELKNWLAGG